MPALTIDQLIFKGTHNSYACGGGDLPWMNHPPDKQIDDFGVWALELDYSLVTEHGGPVPVVGHDREGDGCWGYYLTDYLRAVRRARALRYRPVFLTLEVKTWKRRWPNLWRHPADRALAYAAKREAGMAALREVFGDDLVVLEDWLRQRQGCW